MSVKCQALCAVVSKQPEGGVIFIREAPLVWRTIRDSHYEGGGIRSQRGMTAELGWA